jgi:phosphoglycerate dehydrogenase-like enzyme
MNGNQSVNKNDHLAQMLKEKTLGLIGLGNTAIAIGNSLRAKGISKIKYSDLTIKPGFIPFVPSI